MLHMIYYRLQKSTGTFLLTVETILIVNIRCFIFHDKWQISKIQNVPWNWDEVIIFYILNYLHPLV